jgi:cytochrome b pre-mRNA-processing protein 3
MGRLNFLGRARHERAGFALYTTAVRAARAPEWFAELGVADTLDGRFDLVGLFVALVIHRLRTLPPPGAALAQAVFDAMFADMDFCLREMGVGDMSIARRVKQMWEAFHGRALAYEAPLANNDAAALAEALARNVWRGAPPAGAPARLAAAALAHYRHLQSFDPAAFAAGEIAFEPAAAVLG